MSESPKRPAPKCWHQFCAPQHCRFANTEPSIFPREWHDHRDRGNPMEKFEASRPDLDLDTFGRPLKAGT